MKLTSIKKIVQHKNVKPCSQAVYAGSYLQDDKPVIPGAYELLYTQGDPIDEPSFPRYDPNMPYTDPNRGADRIRLWIRRPARDWEPYNIGVFPHQDTNVIVSNHMSFRWMWSDREDFLAKNQETYIGATASPSVIKIGDTYHMYFCGTTGDPHATTARQFTLYHISSQRPDFLGALVSRDTPRDHSNIAVQNAELWFGDFIPAEKYPSERGITTVSALVDNYLYLLIQVWTEVGGLTVKNGLIRLSLSPPDRSSSVQDYEIWKVDNTWEPVINGRLPDWYTTSDWTTGNPFMWVVEQILLTPYPYRKFGKYMLVASPSGVPWVAFSDNLTAWGAPMQVPMEHDMFVRSPRLIKNGDRWIFNTNDPLVLFGDAAALGCGDQFRGQVMCEADNLV